jgi:hypothetical protein
MAANLTIGRVGLETDLAHPTQINERSDGEDGTISIRGYIKETASLEEAKHLRHQLRGQVASSRLNGLVAVDCVVDPTINGFYVLESANVEISRQAASLVNTGHFPYNISLRKINTSAFSVSLTGGVLTNDHSTSSGSPLVAAPQGAISYSPEATGTVSRNGMDGVLEVFIGVDETDAPIYELDPTTPLDFYEGGCRVRVAKVGSATRRLISGFELGEMNDATDWEIDNSLVKVEYSAAGFTVSMAPDSGGWESGRAMKMIENVTDIVNWTGAPIIIRNDPEQATIRVTQKRSGNQIGRRSLDITIRRGMRFAHFFYHTTIATTLKVHGVANDAATAISTWGVRKTANDGNGNRWVLGSKHANTQDTTNGGLDITGSLTGIDFFFGFEVGGSGAQANDTAADLYLQYIHHLNEIVVPVAATGVLP